METLQLALTASVLLADSARACGQASHLFGGVEYGPDHTEYWQLLCSGPPGMKNLIGLATKRCISCEGKDAAALDMSGADKLRGQTPGWRIIEHTGSLSLRQDWKVTTLAAQFVRECFETAGAMPQSLQKPCLLQPTACQLYMASGAVTGYIAHNRACQHPHEFCKRQSILLSRMLRCRQPTSLIICRSSISEQVWS